MCFSSTSTPFQVNEVHLNVIIGGSNCDTAKGPKCLKTEGKSGSIVFFFQINNWTPLLYMRAILVLTLLAFQAEKCFVVGGCPVHRGMFSGVPGPYPPDASGTSPPPQM